MIQDLRRSKFIEQLTILVFEGDEDMVRLILSFSEEGG
jgi:hypothetical protein